MKLINLRYAGHCVSCGTRLEQHVRAWYDPTSKTVTCTSCRPIESQLPADLPPPGPEPVPYAPASSARTDQEKAAELEQKIAAAFATAGYRVRTNDVREGRSGATHEVDVLAEKTDDLLTLSVAIECKAWASPIDKDVVAKLNEVRRDLGVGHALVVSLNGARPGATTLAAELGVTIWGPDEMSPVLGDVSLRGLQNRPIDEEVGFPRLLDTADALQLVEKETSGRLGIGKEQVAWSGDVWMPVSVVPLTLMAMGIFRRKTATSQKWVVYDLIGGTFVTRLDEMPAPTSIRIDGGTIKPQMKVVDPRKTLDAVTAKYSKATTDATREKLRGQMADLGVPDLNVPTTGTPSPFLYPVHLAIAQKNTTERVIAIDAYRSRVDAGLGHEMSKAITWIRESLEI